MPECVEVLIIAQQLHRLLSQRWIHDLRKNSKSRYYSTPFTGEEELKFPLYVVSVTTKGKMIIFSLLDSLGNPSWLLSNLGMEGRWVRTEENNTGLVLFYGSYSCCPQCVFYDDSRHFGTLRYITNELVFTSILDDLGYDILAASLTNFDPNIFVSCLRKKNKKLIAETLLDQSIIAGIGNYLRSDILYLSQIPPWTLIENLSDEQLYNMALNASKTVLESYYAGGFTIYTYHSVDGSMGKYAPKVYGKTKDDFGNQVYRYIDAHKRTVFTIFPC